MNIENIRRVFFTLFGALATALAPTLPYVLLCTAAVLADCLSALMLARRARKVLPRLTNPDTAKLKSHHFGGTIVTLMEVYALLIFAYYLHMYVTSSMPFDALKLSAGGVIFWQGWSILENMSSCNGARWAKLLQNVMVDKTARHLDIDRDELEEVLNGRRSGEDTTAVNEESGPQQHKHKQS